MVKEASAGGVVFSKDNTGLKLLLIRDRFNVWTLPKGVIEQGETIEQAALREIKEETGITGSIKQKLGEINYSFERNGKEVSKTVHYFLVEARNTDLVPQLEEITFAKWVSTSEALKQYHYPSNLPILQSAIDILRGTE